MLHRVSSCCSDFKHSHSYFFLHCTKGWSWVKRPTHWELPKSSQCRIFLSQPFIFLPRTVSTFLLFMPIQIAQSRRAQGMKLMMIIQMITMIMKVMMNMVMVVKTVGIPNFLWCTSTECDRIFERQFPSLFLPNSLTLPLEWKHLNLSSKYGQLDMFSNKWQFAKKMSRRAICEKR